MYWTAHYTRNDGIQPERNEWSIISADTASEAAMKARERLRSLYGGGGRNGWRFDYVEPATDYIVSNYA